MHAELQQSHKRACFSLSIIITQNSGYSICILHSISKTAMLQQVYKIFKHDGVEPVVGYIVCIEAGITWLITLQPILS